jgi:hypothetical protein
MVMDIEPKRVDEIHAGDLLHITDLSPNGRVFAGVRDYEDGHGVRTFHLFGYASRTLAWHQSADVAKL